MSDIKEYLMKIVGTENVADDIDTLEAYSKDKSFTKPIKPRFVVKVGNAEQVQELIRWANGTNTPLVPVSSGGSHHRGDTVPGVPEAVVVDLSGMKKIISINKNHRIAIIEPGVTYAELQEALFNEGLTLPTSLAPRAEKSVLTSLLEIEPRLNALHQWCFLDPLRCVEVTWGDGNRMYTGEAGGGVMDLEKQWEQEKWQWEPTGPMMLDYYRMLTGAQGTMGIATWASVKCELLPEIHKMYLVPANKLEDLIDFAYRIIRFRFTDEFMLMNGPYLASLLGDTREEIISLRAMLPPWVAIVGIAGRNLLPEDRVAAQEADIFEMAQEFGLEMKPAVEGATGMDVLNAITNPAKGTYWKDSFKGTYQDIFFSTTLDRTPKFIKEMLGLCLETGYPISDIGIYLQPQNMGTSYHCEFTIPYDQENSIELNKVKKLFVNASQSFSTLGAYYLRPYGIWSKLQMNRDAQSMSTIKRLKKIFDPNEIMNPGKLTNY